MAYKKMIISIDRKEEYYQKFMDKMKYDRKADISGTCIHFHTDNLDWKNSWDDNWHFISENIRSHGKIVAVKKGGKEPVVEYDPISRTLYFFDCDYYGWIKSAALALAGDVLEDNHNIFSVHGALLDVGGKGTVIMGPSKTGKTTLSYGLLRFEQVKLVADDWHFFKFVDGEATGYGSEKSTYIRADVASTWPEYSNILDGVKLDNMGRAVVDVSYVIGKGGLKESTNIKTIILLRREKGKEPLKKLKPEEALQYMEKNEYYNPHLLQNTAWKRKVRRRSFLELFKNTEVYLLNTTESPKQTLDRVAKLAGIKVQKLKRIKN